jgi:hypothetical protein
MLMVTLLDGHEAKLARCTFPTHLSHAATGRMGVVALFLFLVAVPVAADPVTLEGITFSDESGGFTILSVTGTGSLVDPFVVIEEVTGSAPMLVIRFLNVNFGNRLGTRGPMGMALVKMVINHSGTSWHGYRIEARSAPPWRSPDDDGLSLGQGWSGRPPMDSSAFQHFRVVERPYDAIHFDGGLVKAGQMVTFALFLTDSIPKPEIFLLQVPEALIASTQLRWSLFGDFPPSN